MKMWPLSSEEVNNNGLDSDGKNRVNVYHQNSNYRGKASDRGGYGYVEWSSSENCYSGEVCEDVQQCNNTSCWYNYECKTTTATSCPTSYDDSDIKVIVDNWANSALNSDDLQKVDGYKVRLIKSQDLLKNLKYTTEASGYYSTAVYFATNKTPRWARGNDYNFWTMDIDEDKKASAFVVDYSGMSSRKMFGEYYWDQGGAAIRPVINLKKEALQTNTQQPSNP